MLRGSQRFHLTKIGTVYNFKKIISLHWVGSFVFSLIRKDTYYRYEYDMCLDKSYTVLILTMVVQRCDI